MNKIKKISFYYDAVFEKIFKIFFKLKNSIVLKNTNNFDVTLVPAVKMLV